MDLDNKKEEFKKNNQNLSFNSSGSYFATLESLF